MKVKFVTEQDGIEAYTNSIEHMTRSELSIPHVTLSSKLDAVMTELMGTKLVRNGPLPTPEAQVKMRAVVRAALEQGCTIPMLIPWGPKKYSGNLDVAELMALRVLNCLNKRIKQHHPQGLWAVIRLEDSTGRIVEPRAKDLEQRMADYAIKLYALIDALEYDFLHPTLESEIVPYSDFLFHEQEYEPLFYLYLKNNDHFSLQALQSYGWGAPISKELVEFMTSRHYKFNKNDTTEPLRYIAKFMACVLARRTTKSTGAHESWKDGHLGLSFSPPTPDEPLDAARVFYRTMPANITRFHLQPWAAKGYITITDAGPKFALMPCGAPPSGMLFNGKLQIEDVSIDADVIME